MAPTYEQWDNSKNPFHQPRQDASAQPSDLRAQDGLQPSSQPQPAQPAQQPAQPAQPAQQPAQPASAVPSPQPAYQAAAAAYPEPAQKKSHGWIVAIVIVVCLFAFSVFCVKSCTDTVSGMGVYGSEATAPPANSIAVLDIDGTIQYDGSACSPEGFKSLLDKAAGDGNVKALILRVNSGGGTATAGEEMAEYLREFKKESGKPVVVSSASINASAAYEISSQADYIYVAKSTEIGAIGTAMELVDLSGLLDMLGIDMDVITSAQSKDSSYGYRPLTDEEREYYQHMIDQINDMFVENVAEGRSMAVEEVRTLATGLAFTGVDAVENGLADEVGTLADAAGKAAELAGVTDYDTYDLSLASYDLSGLYYLLGGSDTDSQRALPLLKQ